MYRYVLTLITLLLLAGAGLEAQQRQMFGPAPSVLLENAIGTGSGVSTRAATIKRTFQAYGATSAGAGSATIVIEVSNVQAPGVNDWITAGTIVLTLSTTRTSDGFTSDAPWTWVRARVSAISGTDATVNVLMGAGG